MTPRRQPPVRIICNPTRHRHSQPAAAWWRTRLTEHPFKAASVTVLTIGGLCLLTFFGRLRFMPDLDLAGASAILAAVAMIGLFVAVIFGGSVIAAGIATRGLFADQHEQLQSRWTVAALAVPAFIFFGLLPLQDTSKADWSFEPMAGWAAASMVVALALRACLIYRAGGCEQTTDATRKQKSPTLAMLGILFGAGFIWWLMPLFVLVSFEAMWPGDRLSSDFVGWLAAWGFVCVAINVFVTKLPAERELIGTVFMGVATLFLLFVFTQNWSAIPVVAVRALGLGETPVGLVLTEQGCHTLNQAARGHAVCRLDAATKQGWACPVLLKSRIGSPLVVEVTSFDTDGKWPAQSPTALSSKEPPSLRYGRIALPKADVLSWPAIAPLGAPKKPVSADVTQLASCWNPASPAMSQEQIDWLREQCGRQPSANATKETPVPDASASNAASKPDVPCIR